MSDFREYLNEQLKNPEFKKEWDALEPEFNMIQATIDLSEGKRTNPNIICHMLMSIDGKVTGDFLYTEECGGATEEYYRINREYQADAFACGSVTMEGSFTDGFKPDLFAYEGVSVPREDHVADETATYYAISFDRTGRVGWKESRIYDEDPGYNDAHIVEVLCEKVSNEYLAYLQDIGVSYIFAGKDEMNVSLAVEKLYKLFGIKKLMLEGGSIINGAFQREGLVDELSLVQVPMVAGSEGKPLLFDSNMEQYKLAKVEQLDEGVNWLRYVR